MKSYIIPLTEIDDVSDQIYRKMLKQEWRDISEKEFRRLVISAGHHYKNRSVNYINIFRFMVMAKLWDGRTEKIGYGYYQYLVSL